MHNLNAFRLEFVHIVGKQTIKDGHSEGNMKRSFEGDELTVLSEKLQEIINKSQISSVFQPIVSLRDGSVLGYEALSRGPKGSELENPEMLFTVAEETKNLWDLERLCRTKALGAMQMSKANATLFLNVNPNIMEDEKFQKGFTKEYLKEFDIDPKKIIFEITERSAITNIKEFKEIIQNYKEQDYKIAIDDAGAGYSGLNLISDVQPHYLKLDMNLIRNIDRDSVKQALVKSMFEFSKITGTFLIAEGIETIGELQTLINIGVHYGQGYFIKRPDSAVACIDSKIANTITEMNSKKNHIYGYNLSDVYIGNLCVSAVTVNEKVLISEAFEMLSKMPESPGFCVTQDGVVKGVVTRDKVYTAVAGVYGYSLYSRQTIAAIMDTDFLKVDEKTPVNTVGLLAMSRPDNKVYDFITVVSKGLYRGIVTIKDLLNKTIEIEVTNATQLNPLTSLPGNILIEKALHSVLNSTEKYCVVYFDIDNFKAYNDVYGFENGDRVIKNLADIITQTVPSADFVGHVGGDDFVAIVRLDEADDICERILSLFDRSTAGFYNDVDKNNGYIITRNRQGFEEQFPLISLSIGGVSIWERRFTNIFELSAESSRVKKECKMIVGSAYMIA